jgi:hypothetical protein
MSRRSDLGAGVLGEESEDVPVFFEGVGLAEGLDVFEECLDGSREREFGFFIGVGDFEAGVFGFEFQAFPLLRFERVRRSRAGGLAQALAVVAPFDEEAGVGGPAQPAFGVAFERFILPAGVGLDLPQNVDARHSGCPLKYGHYYGHYRSFAPTNH